MVNEADNMDCCYRANVRDAIANSIESGFMMLNDTKLKISYQQEVQSELDKRTPSS